MILKDIIDNHTDAKEIVSKLCSKKISRATPTNIFDIEQIIGNAVRTNKYVELLGLWGGSKEGIFGDEADHDSIEFLSTIKNHSHNQLRISLLFCDAHHHYANAVPWNEIDEYYTVMNKICDKKNILLIKLSNYIQLISGNLESKEKSILKEVYNFDPSWDEYDFKSYEQIIGKLESATTKHYRGQEFRKIREEIKENDKNRIECNRQLEAYNKKLAEFYQKLKEDKENIKKLVDKEDIKELVDIYENRINNIERNRGYLEHQKSELHKEIRSTAVDIASYYVYSEAQFLKTIKERYPDTIFFAFSDPEIQRPIAEYAHVPMFYFHAWANGKKFRNEVPWYSNGIKETNINK